MSTSGLVPGAGVPKESVSYRQHEKCNTCMHFYSPNSCEVVKGNVSPDAVCNRWEMVVPDTGKDGEFYQKEYNKVQGVEIHLKGQK